MIESYEPVSAVYIQSAKMHRAQAAIKTNTRNSKPIDASLNKCINHFKRFTIKSCIVLYFRLLGDMAWQKASIYKLDIRYDCAGSKRRWNRGAPQIAHLIGMHIVNLWVNVVLNCWYQGGWPDLNLAHTVFFSISYALNTHFSKTA